MKTFDLAVRNWNSSLNDVTISLDIVLDSFRVGAAQFKEIFVAGTKQPLCENISPAGVTVQVTTPLSPGTFRPGEALTLTLTASAAGVTSSNTGRAEDNSLFGPDTSEGAASIRCFRHLQNLDTATSGVSGITAAKQNYDIDFEDAADGKWADASVYGDRKFTPVTNDALTGYDGDGHLIRNLTVTAAGGDAGLFGRLGGTDEHLVTIQNLTLKNITVTGGAQRAGGVAGYVTGDLKAENVKVIDPHISGSGTDGGGGDIGGLVGRVDGSLTAEGCAVYTENPSGAAETADWIVLN